MSQRTKMIMLLAGVAMAAPVAASAETLREALWKAYTSNPTITAARAGQRAIDEAVPLARSNGMPDITVSGAFNENVHNSVAAIGTPDRYFTGRASLSVPLYLGGAVRNAVKGAKARVEAGQADLRGTEADLFSAVVGAYMDVIRDQAIVERNATAYKVVSGLFLGSLIIPTSFYYLFGVDDNEAWPAVTGFLLSAILPVGYLSLRKFRGGPGFNEFLRYGELKDGWPRKWQISVFAFWLVFVAAAVIASLLMAK